MISPGIDAANASDEICENYQYLFSVECCFDAEGDPLKLSPEYADKGIDPARVDAGAGIIQSGEA